METTIKIRQGEKIAIWLEGIENVEKYANLITFLGLRLDPDQIAELIRDGNKLSNFYDEEQVHKDYDNGLITLSMLEVITVLAPRFMDRINLLHELHNAISHVQVGTIGMSGDKYTPDELSELSKKIERKLIEMQVDFLCVFAKNKTCPPYSKKEKDEFIERLKASL